MFDCAYFGITDALDVMCPPSVCRALHSYQLVWGQRDAALQVRRPGSRLPLLLLGTGQATHVQMFQHHSLLCGWSRGVQAVPQVPAAGQGGRRRRVPHHPKRSGE